MIDEAGESSGAPCPVSAPDGRYKERPCDADPADFDDQQRPRVLDVQAGQVSENPYFLRRIGRGTCHRTLRRSVLTPTDRR